ncbi:hypothetical protein IZY60_06885 [Lutibacter sp. B2]|nr:hypothetical protein [Lutibacter sp. B2]
MYDENLKEIQIELCSLCKDFIQYIKKLEDESVISHEEYLTHTEKKIDFLNKVNHI